MACCYFSWWSWLGSWEKLTTVFAVNVVNVDWSLLWGGLFFQVFKDFFNWSFKEVFFMIKESLTLSKNSKKFYFDNLLADWWRLIFTVENYCLSYLPRYYNSMSICSYCSTWSTGFFAGCTTESTTASATFDAAANISIHTSAKQPAGRLTQINGLKFQRRNLSRAFVHMDTLELSSFSVWLSSCFQKYKCIS